MKTVKNSADLVTTYEQTRAGFLKLALEKNRQAIPFIEEAKALKYEVKDLKKPEDLLNLTHLRSALLAASGLSQKAVNNLKVEDQEEGIRNLIDEFLKPEGINFVDELVFRFLLTKGDALGGKMRNIGGQLGEYQLIRNIISLLAIEEKQFYWLHKNTKTWIEGDPEDKDIELQAKGLSWMQEKEERVLILNLTIPIVRKNIDLCLFSAEKNACTTFGNSNELVCNPMNYIALGELKGGVDPAGADEHWKTARSALQRIRVQFDAEGFSPRLFFVGAAIEAAMAKEIFKMLHEGELSQAANLTSEEQMHELSKWIISL